MNLDARMADHAAKRGPVTVTDHATGLRQRGQLIAWRPTRAPRTPGVTGKYRARVLVAGHINACTFNLNHYTVEPA